MITIGPTQRATIARSLVADDARWLADSVLSAQHAPSDAQSVLALSLIGNVARVVHEGTAIVRSPEPVGVPAFAQLLVAEHADIIARARHATKLLDDTKKTPADLELELSETHARHEAEFTGNAPAFARFLESDTSVVWFENRPLLCLHAMTLRFGIDPVIADRTMVVDISTRLGAGLSVLRAVTGETTQINTTLDLTSLADAEFRDTRLRPFLTSRYDTDRSMASKLVLLMVECEVNVAATLIPRTSPVGVEAAFRAQLSTAYHSARAIRALIEDDPNAAAGAPGTWLTDPEVQDLLLRARALRNQCVHYGVSPAIETLDVSAPMFGLVEALWPGHTFDSASRQVTSVLDKTSDLLASW